MGNKKKNRRGRKKQRGGAVFGDVVEEPVGKQVIHVAEGAESFLKHMPLSDFPNTPGFLKFNKRLGIAFGWAIICKIDGEDYFDLQEDHVEEDALVEAMADFMESARPSKAMHKGGKCGQVLFALPLTTDIAESLGIQTRITGLAIGLKPDPEQLEKWDSGDFRGFSIGGTHLSYVVEEVTDAAA